jgi:C-terminal processing protease CtpA/Prc
LEKKACLKVEKSAHFEGLKSKSLIQEMYLSAIAMTFDPHTSYFSPSQRKVFSEELPFKRRSLN